MNDGRAGPSSKTMNVKYTPITRALFALRWHFTALRHRATWMCQRVFFDEAHSWRAATQQGSYWRSKPHRRRHEA